MAVLLWVPERHCFLKIQEGTGDNLAREDIEAGFTDYLLWTTFAPGELDTDDTWEPELEDGGTVLFEESVTPLAALPDIYQNAFNAPWSPEKTLLLTEEE